MNKELIKKVIQHGERVNQIQVITFKWKEYILEVSITNNKIKSAVIYTDKLENKGWLNKEDCEQLSPLLCGTHTNEISY